MSAQDSAGEIPIFQNPLLDDADDKPLEGTPAERQGFFESTNGTPQHATNATRPPFRTREGTSKAELFYDLFFVANLTVFTNVHEINSTKGLKQYIGFFAILWLTWYQVSMYDVRFIGNSVLDAIAKLCQLGVMIGLAISGPSFQVGELVAPVEDPVTDVPIIGPTYRALTLLLMSSRFVLFLQYLQILFFTRKRKYLRDPVALTATVYFIAGWIYMGLFFSFSSLETRVNITYIAWYIVAGFESISINLIALIWKKLGFQETHLLERMSLLTLIILGEGIIGIAEQCQRIETGYFYAYVSTTIAAIVCSVFAIAFLFVLYIDRFPTEKLEQKRQQLWSCLHFPLHIALVLAVQGITKLLAWTAAQDALSGFGYILQNQTDPLHPNSSAEMFQDTYNYLETKVLANLYQGVLLDSNIPEICNMQSELVQLVFNISGGASDFDAYTNARDSFLFKGASVLLSGSGFEAPPTDSQEVISGDNLDESLDKYVDTVDVMGLVYEYAFITAGLVLILYVALHLAVETPKTAIQWIRHAISALLGLGLCLLSLIELSDVSFGNFLYSSWLLPTMTLVLFVSVVVNLAPIPSMGRHKSKNQQM